MVFDTPEEFMDELLRNHSQVYLEFYKLRRELLSKNDKLFWMFARGIKSYYKLKIDLGIYNIGKAFVITHSMLSTFYIKSNNLKVGLVIANRSHKTFMNGRVLPATTKLNRRRYELLVNNNILNVALKEL
jgi:hypothetical protein